MPHILGIGLVFIFVVLTRSSRGPQSLREWGSSCTEGEGNALGSYRPWVQYLCCVTWCKSHHHSEPQCLQNEIKIMPTSQRCVD